MNEECRQNLSSPPEVYGCPYYPANRLWCSVQRTVDWVTVKVHKSTIGPDKAPVVNFALSYYTDPGGL